MRGCGAVNVMLLGFLLAGSIGIGWAQTAASAPRAEFEVASIKPNNGIDEKPGMTVLYGGHLTARYMSVRILIGAAYDIDESFQISGGQRWTETERYDISAQAPGDVPTSSFEWRRPMLQSLLAERFKLALHREMKEVPIYELVAAKGGIKIAASKPGACIVADPQKPRLAGPGEAPPRFCDNLHFTKGGIEAVGVDMTRLANALAAILGRPVVNKTGFAGIFDIHMEYAPVEVSGGSADSSAPSLFTALQEQMGLRLESAKGPVEVLVIDHVERPSEN